MKKIYEELSIKIVDISVKDVITTSAFDGEDDLLGGSNQTGGGYLD